jgi:exodeoxyribonuclease V beta subunit
MDRALSGARGARFAARLASRYPAALIDEFQDTDAIQYRIFRAIYGERGALLLIGDPKQAIYAFRGADVFTYLRAARDATGTFTLELNWRSDPGLIHAQNTLFGRHPEAFLLPEISYRAVKPAPGATDRVRATPALAPLRFVFVEQAAQRGKRSRLSKTWAALNLPGLVAAEISALLADDVRLGEHRLEPGDIAVLTRTNRQALDVQQQLRQLGIPSVLHGDASVLESTEAQDLGYVLRALADPSRANAVRAALATPLLGLDAGALYALRQDEREWERWIERFRAWHLIWLERGFVQAFRSLLHEQDVLARLLGLVSGERITTNVLHLVELLHQAAREQHLGVSGLLQWFDQVRFDQSARDGMAPEAMQIRLESDDRAVQLTTMHKSKGLEYPVVVCPYLWDGVLLRRLERRYCRYHDPDTHGFVLDLTSDETARQSATREARAENLRLCYVALTRAKHLCVAFTGAFKHYEQSSLAHLVHGASPDRRLSDADDALLLADYAELARESGGAIALARAGERAARAYRPENASAPELAARRPSRRVHAAYRNSSFSALTSVEGLITGRDSSERDRDVAAPGELLGDEVQGSSSVVLAEFPRGPTAGDALHWILERLDFGDPSETAVASIVRQGLARRAIDVERWTGAVTQALCDVLATPLALGKPELRLQAVGLAQRKNELEFLFPVTPLASGGLVSPAELARVFRQHGESELERYVPELERLAFTPFTGFLRGFIDLVFFHAGRWYVVDYKSNHLGAEPADYAALRLAGAMREHHYYLQYHLYVLALHRYLAQRIADYDYERDFGGVYYLFLRGMHPRHGARYGVFHDRPPLELVRALSDVFGGAGGRAA